MTENQQSFETFADWRARAAVELTSRGFGEKAACYDAKGRLCDGMEDFERARDEDAFPVLWVWPDQMAVALGEALRGKVLAEDRVKVVERLAGIDGSDPRSRQLAELSLGWIATARDGQRDHVLAHHARIDAARRSAAVRD